tara:strand:+ start:1675 stop:1884 length:210 start_codon:yes stop_codon:yes gene_type:complete
MQKKTHIGSSEPTNLSPKEIIELGSTFWIEERALTYSKYHETQSLEDLKSYERANECFKLVQCFTVFEV